MYQREPDLILANGKFVTLDPQGRIVTGLAARAGRIAALGASAEIEALAGPASRVLDLEGRTVIPGIVDSHCHPDGAAVRLSRWQNLEPARIDSRAGLLAAVARRCEAARAGETSTQDAWFAGYRFDERKSGGYPTLAELDGASRGRPLFILRRDGHLGLANSAAFQALGIDPATPDPPFGVFDRDPASGAFTGLVRETAPWRRRGVLF